jgi:hypothetical protein
MVKAKGRESCLVQIGQQVARAAGYFEHLPVRRNVVKGSALPASPVTQ